MPPTAVGLIITSPLATCLARRYVFSYVLACYILIIHFVTICVYLHLWQPLPPGEKRKKEGWENIWYVGMYGSMLLAGVLLYYKPDTRCVRFYDISTLNAYSELQLVDMGVQRSKAKDGGAGGEDRLSLICIRIRVVFAVASNPIVQPKPHITVCYAYWSTLKQSRRGATNGRLESKSTAVEAALYMLPCPYA